MSVNREALLRAAQQFSSSSESDEGSNDDKRDRSPARKRHKRDKEKHQKHSKHKHSKKGKRHKRSEQEKIRLFEQKAAAIGATSIIPRLPTSLSSLATAVAGDTGDAAVLDTSGDPNNAMFESLYAGSVPRYNRLDPMNLVTNKARLAWHAQLLQPDADAGNSRADRYYKGRHVMLERSRQAKRIHLADLRPKPHSAAQLQLQLQLQQPPGAATAGHSSNSSRFLQPRNVSLLQLPAVHTAAAAPASATGAVSGAADTAAAAAWQAAAAPTAAKKLSIPAPAFIPLQPPRELINAAAGEAAGTTAAAAAAAAGRADSAAGMLGMGGSSSAKLDPQVLVEQVGLSADELVLQATRQWNVLVRERPQDEQLWLDFAAFQYTAAKLLQQRGRSDAAAAATAEKQVALLTKALAHHPQSSVLLLELLRSYAVIAPDAAALAEKWRGVLARQRGSWALWREYLALQQSNFASFTISSVQRCYQQALHALYMELLATRRKAAAARKQQQQQQQWQDLTQQQLEQLSPAAAAAAAAASGGSSSSTAAAAVTPLSAGEEGLELQLVQLLLGLLRSELLAGHCEPAVAKIQALLEYHLFQPPTPPGGPAALLRLFAAYWRSGSARIGEAGARGWAYWCCWNAMGLQPPGPQQQQQQQEEEQQQAAEEPAGWSGWFEVPQQQQQQQQQGDSADSDNHHHQQQQQQQQHKKQPKPRPAKPSSDQSGSLHGSSDKDSDSEEGEVSAEPDSEVHSEEDEQQGEELDEVELMLQLGVQLEEQLQAVEQEGLPGHILNKWVEEEASRSSSQWQPLHPNTLQQQQQQQADDSAPDPSRIIGFDAVEPCLFPIRSMQALKRLVLGCVELLGAPLGHWCSSNCPTPLQQASLGVPDGLLGPRATPAGGPRTAVGPVDGNKQWSDASADGVGAAAAAAEVGAGPRVTPGSSNSALSSHQPWSQASDERWEMLVSLLERLVAGGPCSNWHELCRALLLLHASKPSAAQSAAGKQGNSGSDNAAAATSEASSGERDAQLIALTVDGAAAATAAGQSSTAAASSSSSWPSSTQLAAVRSAAKRLLSEQQDNLLLYDAYGCCEAAMGQIKTARKVLESALTLASAAAAAAAARGAAGNTAAGSVIQSEAAAAAAAVPLLALHLAQVELSAIGSKGALERAHAALHACLAVEPYAPAAAAAAKGAAAAAAGQETAPPNQQQQQHGILLAAPALAKARRGFQDRIPQLLASGVGTLTPAAAATVAAAALFELTVGLRQGQAGKGVDAAATVIKQVLSAAPEPIRAVSAHYEQLQGLHCHLLVAAATGAVHQLVPFLGTTTAGSYSTTGSTVAAAAAAMVAAVPPACARSALATALLMYPHSQPLLNLQVQLDTACYTLAGLRRQLAAMAEQNPSPGLWGIAIQAESLRPGGRVRLRALFERALAAPSALQRHQQQKLQRQRQQHAWAAAVAEEGCEQQQTSRQAPKQQQEQQQQEQQRLLQGATAASSAPVLLDLAVQDGYRGWGNCEELWLSYMQYELGLGKPDAARKLFLRALHECPGSKALWLRGFRALSESLQPRESSGLLSAMQEREVLVRADVYEVLLAEMAAQQQ